MSSGFLHFASLRVLRMPGFEEEGFALERLIQQLQRLVGQ